MPAINKPAAKPTAKPPAKPAGKPTVKPAVLPINQLPDQIDTDDDNNDDDIIDINSDDTDDDLDDAIGEPDDMPDNLDKLPHIDENPNYEIIVEEEEVINEINEINDANEDNDGCLYKFALNNNANIDELDDDILNDDDFDIEVANANINQNTDIVKPEDRITHPVLSKYERVRILGIRTRQLALGAKSMIKQSSKNNLSSKELAKLELQNKVIPFIIERTLPNGKREHWRLPELETVL